MKKFIIPILLVSTIMLCSCDSEKSAISKVTASPKATVSTTAPPTDTPKSDTQEKEAIPNQEAQTIYIINGMSAPIYGLYLTANKEGNPGENILGDTPLAEGEEIGIPYVYDLEDKLYIIIEDENGNTTATDSFTLEDGLNIELRSSDGKLEAVVQ